MSKFYRYLLKHFAEKKEEEKEKPETVQSYYKDTGELKEVAPKPIS